MCFFGGCFFRERPGQHELGLKHRVEVVYEAIQGRRQISMHGVSNPALNVGDDAPGVPLVPGLVERLGGDAQLDDEIARQVLRLDPAALFLPEPDQRRLVGAHDDPGVGAAKEVAPVSDFPVKTLNFMAFSGNENGISYVEVLIKLAGPVVDRWTLV
jgi:hypothetical protein